jgi:hypothetical protein
MAYSHPEWKKEHDRDHCRYCGARSYTHTAVYDRLTREFKPLSSWCHNHDTWLKRRISDVDSLGKTRLVKKLVRVFRNFLVLIFSLAMIVLIGLIGIAGLFILGLIAVKFGPMVAWVVILFSIVLMIAFVMEELY